MANADKTGLKRGTPFISVLLPPTARVLRNWDASLPPLEQPKASSIPRTFVDAMRVRDEVYAQEQGVPRENEFDADDARCVHWVIYMSEQRGVEHEVCDPATSELVTPQCTETSTVPIGTLRLVPFPHPPHPRKGGVYVGGELVNVGDPVVKEGELDITKTTASGSVSGSGASSGVSTPVSGIAEDLKRHRAEIAIGRRRSLSSPEPEQKSSAEIETVKPLTESEARRASTPKDLPVLDGAYVDPPTVFHDGQEPYVKLGRLAVLNEFRGQGIAGQLVRAAVDWTVRNPDALNRPDFPPWKGLFHCHAQENAIRVWESYGFLVDDAMGRWVEEGIPHVGMFMRAELK